MQLVQKSIPFETETVSSPDVELGTQEITQPGENGLAIARTRIRYEDGQEVSRVTEDESVVRPPQTRIVNTGTKIVVNTATVDGVTLEYWRAYEMYATIYSPCNSGTGGCSYGTASGLKAGKGVVAVDPSMFSFLQGQRIYVPGYGYAVIGDVGGGYIVEDLIGVSRYRWIDLGFDDNNIVDMSGWHTVYFPGPRACIRPAGDAVIIFIILRAQSARRIPALRGRPFAIPSTSSGRAAQGDIVPGYINNNDSHTKKHPRRSLHRRLRTALAGRLAWLSGLCHSLAGSAAWPRYRHVNLRMEPCPSPGHLRRPIPPPACPINPTITLAPTGTPVECIAADRQS